MTSVNDEHPEIALTNAVSVTEDGNKNVILFIDEHSSKAYWPISVTEEGIVISVNDEHPQKAHSLISVTEEGIMISVNDEHPLNAYLWIFFYRWWYYKFSHRIAFVKCS